jgi:response regulator RpfG family c-di-GMP phosphodiesterase/GGDEF domain-containing protein
MSARLQKEKSPARAQDMPIYHITKPFDPKEVVALVQGYLMHKERMVSINPLTGLPNRTQMSKEIDRLVRQETQFATIYIALHDLKAINKAYGYAQGDRVVQLMADIVSESVRLFGNAEDIAGYFGGDKFVVISTPWKARTLCRRIIADFGKRIKSLHSGELLVKGFPPYGNRPAGKEQTPVMSIHIAVVTNQKRRFRDSHEVTEVATEQIEYLKCSPESNCYFDLKTNGVEPFQTMARKEMVPAYKEGLKAMQGVMTWVDFLMKEIETPVNMAKACLDSLDIKTEDLSEQQTEKLKTLQDNHRHLIRVVEGITNLVKSDELRGGPLLDEVDIEHILDWIIKQVEVLAEQKGIQVDIDVPAKIGRIIRDKKSLTQSLLYIIRSEIRSAPPESHLYISLAEKNEEHIHIEINNPDRSLSSRQLKALFKKPFESPPGKGTPVNELYPARILLRGLGGELEAASEKGQGITYRVIIPKRWRSYIQDVSTLQLAMEISRKEAQDTLRNIQRTVASLVDEVPATVNENFKRLSSKVQEMGVLGNRSLFLADNLSNRLEAQQDRLLQQDVEQGATLEAILTICGEIARHLQVENAFNLESAKRVVKYALSLANEFKVSESDRQALHYAAMFKDMALTISPADMIEQELISEITEATAIKSRVDTLWNALTGIRYLSPALELVQYRYERYDGRGRRFGARGTDIPLGARILAVADTFERLTSGRSPQGKLAPQNAIEQIVEDSGLRYDPHVVSALLQVWKRKETALK